MYNQSNYGVRFDGPYGIDYMMNGIAKEVAKRCLRISCRGKKITLKVMKRQENAKEPSKWNGHGLCHNLSRTREIPGKATRDSHILSTIGMRLLEDLNVEKDEIRGLGLVVSALTFDSECQSLNGLNTWLKPNKSDSLSSRRDANSFHSLPRELDLHQNKAEDLKCDLVADENGLQDIGSVTGGSVEEDGQLLLPSQIDQEVLDHLPDDLKAEIQESRIQSESKATALSSGREKVNVYRKVKPTEKIGSPRSTFNKSRPRRKQLSVKDMMSLIAAKRGHEPISNALIGEVSLTQLDKLPISLQIEVINQSSALKPKPKVPLLPETYNFSVAEDEIYIELDGDNREVPISNQCHEIDTHKPLLTVSRSTKRDEMEEESFYALNICPMHQYMDSHVHSSIVNVDKVKQFFQLLLEEKRQCEAIILLRSIKRRTDEWSTVYNDLCSDFQTNYEKKSCCRLDPTWM